MALPFLLACSDVPQVVPQPDGCLPVQDDRIYARDVAAAVPAFSGVAADFVLGYAPAPGTRRVFKGDALQKLARNQGVTVEAACPMFASSAPWRRSQPTKFWKRCAVPGDGRRMCAWSCDP